MDTNSSIWKLSASNASFCCNGLECRLALSDPSGGMSLWHEGTAIEGSLWSFSQLLGEKVAPTESYVRGDDLVVSMPATKSFPCETVWYWSVSPRATGVVIRLTLSLQTDLLDTSPVVKLTSTLIGEHNDPTTEQANARCLATIPGIGTCYEVAHPSDQSECVIEREGQIETLSITLPFLEKGVIRRARVAAIFLPTEVPTDKLQEAIAEFVEEPLPLTT